jgi:Arc/MetJ-type ribon-helix-helix transcriptional regulator
MPGHTDGITQPMSVAKVAISMDQRVLRHLDSMVKNRVFRSRSEAIQRAVEEKLGRLEKSRLARECAKLSPREEQRFAEIGLEADIKEWPPY